MHVYAQKMSWILVSATHYVPTTCYQAVPEFINCNKCTTLLGAVDNGESYVYMGPEDIQEIFVSSS